MSGKNRAVEESIWIKTLSWNKLRYLNYILIALVVLVLFIMFPPFKSFLLSPIKMGKMIVTYSEMYKIKAYIKKVLNSRVNSSVLSTEKSFRSLVKDLYQENILLYPYDMWNNDYVYKVLPDKGKIIIISKGPDKIEGTEDDLRLVWDITSEKRKKKNKNN